MNDLTDQQELFCQYLAMGMTQYMAYKSAFNSTTDSKASLYAMSCKLANDVKIKLRTDELKTELSNLRLWDRADALLTLKDIIEDNDSEKRDIIAAIKEMNKLCGFDIVDNNQKDTAPNIKKVTFNVVKK